MKAGYARESTTRPEQDQALAWQVDRLKRYGCEKILVDRMSGASHKRPGYKELIEMVKQGVVTEVVICSLTRLGRSSRQIFDAIDLFVEKGVKLTALDGSIDLSSAGGRANVQIQGVFAQLERELIRERISAGFEGARANRRAIHVPFGYKKVKGNPVIDADVAPIARWLRQIAVEKGLLKASQFLNEKYPLPLLPKAPRTPCGIRNWLRTPTLYGHLQYGRHKKVQILHRDNHPALFTDADLLEFEEALKFRQHHHGFKRDPLRFPFSGLVDCASCGANMRSHGRNTTTEKAHNYYCCTNYNRRCCDNRNYVKMGKIEDAVFKALTAKAEEIANRAVAFDSPKASTRLVELQLQLHQLQHMPMNPHIEAAIAGIKADITVLEMAEKSPLTLHPEREKLLVEFLDPEFWENISPENKPKIYRLLIKSIRCNKGEVESVELWI